MCGIEIMKAVTTTQDHFSYVRKMVGGAGCPVHLVGVNKMVGARHQRPQRVTPRWGLKYSATFLTQGAALGYRVDAPLARKIARTKGATPVTIARTKGAKPCSLGHRPRFDAPPIIPSPERAKPIPEAHK